MKIFEIKDDLNIILHLFAEAAQWGQFIHI